MRLRSTAFSYLVGYLFLISALPAAAQQATPEPNRGPGATTPVEQAGASVADQIEELRRRVDVLAAELEQLPKRRTPPGGTRGRTSPEPWIGPVRRRRLSPRGGRCVLRWIRRDAARKFQ